MIAFIVSLLLMAQGGQCDPFVDVDIVGLVPIGTAVVLDTGEQGRVDAYYIQSCFPGAAVFGLGSEAYVINTETYGPSGARIDTVVNRDSFEVR